MSQEAGHTKRMSMIVGKGTFDWACPPSSWPPPLRHVGTPNIVAAVPGVDAAAIAMMKSLIGSKGVPSIQEFRATAIESGEDDRLSDDHHPPRTT